MDPANIILVLVAGASLAALHLAWRRKYRELEVRSAKGVADAQNRSESIYAEICRERETLEALLDSMSEGLLVLSAEKKIILANPAFRTFFGVSGEPRGKSLVEVIRSPALTDLVNSLGHEKQLLGQEVKLAHPERWLQVNGTRLKNPLHGDAILLVFHDLTREKRLESARKEFVANVSHELRTPLSLVKGYAETLLGGAKDDPVLAEKFLRTIEKNAERLRRLMDDLLTVSELESGRVSLKLEAVNLREFVGHVIEDFAEPSLSRNVILLNETPELVVEADTNRLEQVLDNLLENAVKYGRENGTVNITAHDAGDGMVEVKVKDDGPGIPAESIDRVFERFYRVDKSRSRDQGGTGLGLAIVKHIVQSHQGRVWATSAPGQGATFHFTLPSSRR